MTAVPSQTLPQIATDSTVSSGADTGRSTRLALSGVSQGFLAGRLAARVLNWVIGGLGDWLAYVREATPMRLSDTPRTVFVPLSSVAEVSGVAPASSWAIESAGSLIGGSALNKAQPILVQAGTGSDAVFVWQLSDILPRDALLTRLSITVIGGSTWTALPSTMPQLSLYYLDGGSALHFLPYDSGDDSPNVTAWKSAHQIVLDLSSTPVDLDNAGVSSSVRIFACLDGWADVSGASTYYYKLEAEVKAKAWT